MARAYEIPAKQGVNRSGRQSNPRLHDGSGAAAMRPSMRTLDRRVGGRVLPRCVQAPKLLWIGASAPPRSWIARAYLGANSRTETVERSRHGEGNAWVCVDESRQAAGDRLEGRPGRTRQRGGSSVDFGGGRGRRAQGRSNQPRRPGARGVGRWVIGAGALRQQSTKSPPTRRPRRHDPRRASRGLDLRVRGREQEE